MLGWSGRSRGHIKTYMYDWKARSTSFPGGSEGDSPGHKLSALDTPLGQQAVSLFRRARTLPPPAAAAPCHCQRRNNVPADSRRGSPPHLAASTFIHPSLPDAGRNQTGSLLAHGGAPCHTNPPAFPGSHSSGSNKTLSHTTPGLACRGPE